MGRCRVVQPDMVRLQISDGDWIDVKKYLTHGERTQASASVIGEVRVDGWMRPNFEGASIAQIVAYVVDWSMVDSADKRIPCDTDVQKIAALKSFDDATVEEMSAVIEAHAKKMEAELAEAKKPKAGSSDSALISASAG